MRQKLSLEELKNKLETRTDDAILDLRNVILENMDLSGWDLHRIDFSKSDFLNVKLDDCNLEGIRACNTLFKEISLKNVNLKNAVLCEADFRGCNLSGADICGADMFAAMLYRADLSGVRSDEKTKFFKLYCPETDAFIAWKVCFNRRIVRLLVPKDAVRVSGTTNEVRCNKAKVLSVKSIDEKETYPDAHSYVDEDFIYRTGEMVYAKNFNPNRFIESGGGIHVWLTRDEAVAYMG